MKEPRTSCKLREDHSTVFANVGHHCSLCEANITLSEQGNVLINYRSAQPMKPIRFDLCRECFKAKFESWVAL